MAGTDLETAVLQNGASHSNKQKSYSFEEAVNEAITYFSGDQMAAKNWVNKYALKDSFGNIYESNPDQMHWRIANEISRIEKEKGYPNPIPAEKVHSLLANFNYIVPQGSPMSGIGNNYQVVSLSNCFVIGNQSDSYGGIMKTDQEQVQLMKRRGGVGHDLSHIRPAKTQVMNSALTSTGVVPFMERYSNSTREVAQDGRRGALMLSLSIKHPDAEKFIDAKMLEGKVTGANISTRIYDDFMKAVQGDGHYTQQFPVDSKNPSITQQIDAKKLWKKIIHNAWKSAEPGVLFWDTIIRESVPDCYADLGFKTVSTNPCGEIPICLDDSCRLLALNLYSYVNSPFTKNAFFNTELFKEHTHYAQRIMDDIVDLEIEKIEAILQKIDKDPEPEEVKAIERDLWKRIMHKTKLGRRTGIGVTGEGDMLAALGITYGNEQAIAFSEELHKKMAIETYRSSVNLAKERGAFEIYDSAREENNPFIKRLIEADPQLGEEMRKYGRRNIALLTIAPTGTTSLMTQTTSGLEPAFLPVYERRRKVNPNDKAVVVDYIDPQGDAWEKYKVFHHKFETWLEVNGYNVEHVKEIADESIRNEEKAAELESIVKLSPYHKATSNDVDWLAKVKLQGAVQKWVDHSISVTVNLPKNASEELVDKLYQTAWEYGCKGVTIYREGSRDGVLLTGKEGKAKTQGELEEIILNSLKRGRPEVVEGKTVRTKTPYNNHAFVTLNHEVNGDGKHKLYESFVSIGKAGGDLPAISEGYGRLISLALKVGVPPEYIIEQLEGIGGETQDGIGPNKVKSLPDAIAKGMKKILESEGQTIKSNGKNSSGNLCNECGSALIMEEGCQKCLSCGNSKC